MLVCFTSDLHGDADAYGRLGRLLRAQRPDVLILGGDLLADGDTDDPVAIELTHSGDHRIRIQPRQTPHRIDQIWLSRSQLRIPNTLESIK